MVLALCFTLPDYYFFLRNFGSGGMLFYLRCSTEFSIFLLKFYCRLRVLVKLPLLSSTFPFAFDITGER